MGMGKSGHLSQNLQQLLDQIEVPWSRLTGPGGQWAAGEPPRCLNRSVLSVTVPHRRTEPTKGKLFVKIVVKRQI